MISEPAIRTRFAPSPSGLLHLGHAFSALAAFDFARKSGGEFVLRIEDIDTSRCRPEFEEAIFEDLAWLGLQWREPVRRQSDHLDEYEQAIETLTDQGLTYPCFCTRKEILSEIEGAIAAPHGPDGPHYPGTCRTLGDSDRRARISAGEAHAIRLNVSRAEEHLKEQGLLPLTYLSIEEDHVEEKCVRPDLFGDIVLARKDIPTSYHVSVVHDDALEGITHVVRGEDLLEATHIQRVLQALWGLEAPQYVHHPLVRDAKGRRLAKRDKDLTIKAMRDAGKTSSEVKTLALAWSSK